MQPLFAYSCACAAGYEGAHCEYAVRDECASAPCLHGAACVDGLRDFTCSCPPNTLGRRCENQTCAVYEGGTSRCVACSAGTHALADGACAELAMGLERPSSFQRLGAFFGFMQAQGGALGPPV